MFKIKERVQARKTRKEVMAWDVMWETLLYGKPEGRGGKRFWTHGPDNNEPYYDEDTGKTDHSRWWLPQRGGDEYGRHTIIIPYGWQRTVVIPLWDCMCRDFEPGEAGKEYGCPMRAQSVRWMKEQQAHPLAMMLEELDWMEYE